MGGMEGTCGAVSGACVLAGMKASTGNLEKPNSKKDSYQLSKEIVKQFKEQNGSVTCKEIKGVGTGNVLRACSDCIKDAAAIAEKNKIGKTRDLSRKLRETKGIFHAKMGTIQDRNYKDLTEAEEVKKSWQEYTELYKKGVNYQDNHGGMYAHSPRAMHPGV